MSAGEYEYASEEVGEAFTEWCASENIEARDDQEYRTIRAAFTAGMNEISRYGHPVPLPADLDAGRKSGTQPLAVAPPATSPRR